MTTPACNNSPSLTTYSQAFSRCSSCLLNYSCPFELSQLYLKKSIFDPTVGLAQSFKRRKHLSNGNNPQVQIIHSCPKWLLLEAPQVKANFFQILKKGKLGNLDQQLLKLFKSFVSLTKSYGFFRPTQKMIFMKRTELKVWINEDIFSNKPLMPIHQGKDSQKYFVIAFLAMLSSCLEGWQKITNITTIEQTLMALQWRCKLASGNFSTINPKLEETQITLDQSYQNSIIQKNNKLSLNSTSSTLGKFSQMFMSGTSMGETKIVQPLQIPLIQLQMDNLFGDENILTSRFSDETEEGYVSQFQEVLIW